MLGGLGVAADGDALRLGQHAVEPFVALRQRLRVRVQPLRRTDAVRARHQLLMDAQVHLAAHLHRVRQQQIQQQVQAARLTAHAELVTALGGGLGAGNDAPTQDRQDAPATPRTLAVFDQ